MLYFKISDFNITGEPIPEEIADKILIYHLYPLSLVREYFGYPIFISKKSAYRPEWWEKARNRSGKGEHVFLNKGASDITINNFETMKWELIKALIAKTKYTRIAIYDKHKFLHCDYAGEERYLYNEKWEKIQPMSEVNLIWP